MFSNNILTLALGTNKHFDYVPVLSSSLIVPENLERLLITLSDKLPSGNLGLLRLKRALIKPPRYFFQCNLSIKFAK